MAILRLDESFAEAVVRAAGVDPEQLDLSTLEVVYSANAEKVTLRAVCVHEVDAAVLRVLIKAAATEKFKGTVPELSEVESRLDEIDEAPLTGPEAVELPVKGK